MKHWLRIGVKIIIILLISLLLPVNIEAAASSKKNENKTILKVAFPGVKGVSETHRDGSRSGIFYDFLMEISKYTGWEYEYVSGTSDALFKAVEQNRVDLIGGVYYKKKYQDTLYYPEYDIGYDYALLLSRKDDNSIRNSDLRTLNNKTIGVYKEASDEINELKYFLEYSNISCKIKKYENLKEYEQALENKKVDAMLGNDFYMRSNYNVVAKFKVEPYYIATNVQNVSLGEKLNWALKKIYEADAGFAEELYYKYFPEDYQNTIVFSNDEKEFIRTSNPIKVALVGEFYPLNYNGSNENNGIARKIFSLIEKRTGLKFEYVYGESYLKTIELVQQGKADLLGSFLDDDAAAAEKGLIKTKNYVSLDQVIIKNKLIDYPKEAKIVAIVEGRKKSPYLKGKQIRCYKNYEECMRAVNDGEADFTVLLSHLAENLMNHNSFNNTAYIGVVRNKRKISIAAKKGIDERLYSILNKTVNNFTEEEIEDILTQNMVSNGEKTVTLRTLIYSNPIEFINIMMVVIIFFMIIIAIIAKLKLKSKIMETNLAKAEEANRTKAEFLSKMSHEIRTPMNAIIGLTNLAKMSGEATETIENQLNKIESSSKFLLSLVNDVLDMSKIENKKMSIIAEPFNLIELLKKLEDMVYFQAYEKEIEVLFEHDIKHEIVVGDLIRIKQVLMNLLSNALKFTKEHGRVRLAVEEKESDGNYVTISFSVKDNGIGIKKEDLNRIFESFEQVSMSWQNEQGTGLGLAISSRLVKLMGGELKVKSEFGQGSEFYFDLRLPIGTLEKKETDEGLEKENYDIFEGMKILLAEDNDLNAEIVISLLEMQGAVVERATNGEEAVQMLKENQLYYYNAVLMDVHMPVMDGISACREIRSLDREDAKQIPIIAMTANTFDEDKKRTREVGMNDFVPKPFEVEKMYQVLKKSFLEH